MRTARAVMITFILGACGASDRPGVVARDSAGTRIVENEPDATRTAPFAVAMEPTVQIGAVDGPEEQTFRSVAGTLRLDDGRILVADVDRVLVYDAKGKPVRLERAPDQPLSSDATLAACIGDVDLSDGLTHFSDYDAAAGTIEERT